MSFLAETNVQKSKHSLIKYGGTKIGALSNLCNYKNSENVWNDCASELSDVWVLDMLLENCKKSSKVNHVVVVCHCDFNKGTVNVTLCKY